MVADPMVQKAIDDARIAAEMETLLANRPQYTQAVPGTDRSLEPGSTRALTSTAAEIKVWNRETGEESLIIFDAIRAQVKKVFPQDHPNPRFAGRKVWTMHPHDCVCGDPSCDPAPQVRRGEMACPLSMFNKDRSEAEKLGYGEVFCRKPAYFKSSLAVERHVEKSHPEYFRIRKRAEEEREKEADRALQRAILEQLGTPRGRKAAE